MADTVEQQDIRGLDIDKLAKGFAERQYVFKGDCSVSKMTGDSIRWFQKTAGTLEATAPSYTKNVSPLSLPATLEVSWTRNTSYPKKYFVEGFISMEDIQSAELDVLATTVRDLTLVITRDVDADIYDVVTESFTAGSALPSNVNGFNVITEGGDNWNAAAYAADPIKDILHAKKLIADNDYNPEGASLWLSPLDYKSLVSWLISGKGSSVPSFASQKLTTGVVLQILGLNVKVSNNVTASEAVVIVPQRATTFKQHMGMTSRVIKEEGVGSRIRVWESGIAYNTDPKAICLMIGTQA